jgi:hypothetical protein
MFVSKTLLYLTDIPLGSPLKGRLLAFPKPERLARDKHSSLFRTLVNYDLKKFYNIGPTNGKDNQLQILGLFCLLVGVEEKSFITLTPGQGRVRRRRIGRSGRRRGRRRGRVSDGRRYRSEPRVRWGAG